MYSSPLDDINQLLFFSDTMREAFAREPVVRIRACLLAGNVLLKSLLTWPFILTRSPFIVVGYLV